MKHKHKKVLLTNFLSLSSVQVANYILSLITVPYLVRILGADKFGLLAFAQAFIQYFVLLTDYGFNLSAVREASINRSDSNKLNQVFSAVLFIKFSLMLLSFILMLLIVFAFERFRDEWLVYFFTFGMVLGSVLFPVWFFQGIESMKQIAVLDLLSKVIFTVSIFVFVRERGDYIYVPLINSLGVITSGVVGFWLAVGKFGVKVIMPKMEEVKRQLKEGWYVFISTVAISGYTNFRIFAVGLIADNTITGYYAIAERIMNVIQMFPYASLLQTLYPKLAKLYAEDSNKAIILTNKLQNYIRLILLIELTAMYFASPLIVKLIAGNAYSEVILTLRILLLAIFFINANMLKVHFLLISGKSDVFMKIHILMGIFGVPSILVMTYFFSIIGPAITIVLIALFVLVATERYFVKELEVIHA